LYRIWKMVMEMLRNWDYVVVEFELSSPRTSFGRSTGMSRSGRIWSFRSLAVQQRGTRGFLGVYFFG
jgi:hypothetical protein